MQNEHDEVLDLLRAARVIGQVTYAGLRRLLSQPLEGLPQRPARRACRTRSGAGTRLGRGAAGTAQRPAPVQLQRPGRLGADDLHDSAARAGLGVADQRRRPG